MPEPTTTQTAEIAALTALLREDWRDWLDTDEEFDGWKTVEVINGENRDWTRTVEVITRGPSGQHYSWEYEEGLSEDHPDFGPCEYGDPAVTPVYPADRTVVVRTWEVTPAQQDDIDTQLGDAYLTHAQHADDCLNSAGIGALIRAAITTTQEQTR